MHAATDLKLSWEAQHPLAIDTAQLFADGSKALDQICLAERPYLAYGEALERTPGTAFTGARKANRVVKAGSDMRNMLMFALFGYDRGSYTT
ncbi:MAG: hypothetical protein ACPGOY_05445 [Rhodospirillaceae bacterium]